MKTLIFFAAWTLSSFSSYGAPRELLFEGYSKILSGGVHVGYTVSRYEFDPKSKKFFATIFTKTGALGSDITESITASADSDLNPLSYEYTSLVGKNSKTIDAKFKKMQMSAVVKDGSKESKIELKVPKGVFLSQFLIYLMLKSKSGLRSDSNYNYKAIAEEDGKIYEGQALVGSQEKYNGLPVFKILNNFKDTKFVAYVTDRGEVVGVSNPAQNISTELMAKPSEAMGNFSASPSLVKKVFGDVPQGTTNIVSKALQAEALSATPSDHPKEVGIPPGKGIQIKSQSPNPPANVNPSVQPSTSSSNPPSAVKSEKKEKDQHE